METGTEVSTWWKQVFPVADRQPRKRWVTLPGCKIRKNAQNTSPFSTGIQIGWPILQAPNYSFYLIPSTLTWMKVQQQRSAFCIQVWATLVLTPETQLHQGPPIPTWLLPNSCCNSVFMGDWLPIADKTESENIY